MARYGLETDKSPEEVIDQAVGFFGREGIGLNITERKECCISFEGGGGHVFLTVSQDGKTDVELVTREWDYDVKRFVRQIA